MSKRPAAVKSLTTRDADLMVEHSAAPPPGDPFVLSPEELARRCAEQRALRVQKKRYYGSRRECESLPAENHKRVHKLHTKTSR